MTDWIQTLIALGFAVGIIGLVAWSAARAAKRAAARNAALLDYARHREWEFRPSDGSLVNRYDGAPFGRGHSRSATNVFAGRHDGRHFVAFDYAYTTGSGKNRTRHQCSVVALDLGLATPGLAVGPTGDFGWLVNAITGRDVQVGIPAFDQAFTVTSPSPEFARDVLHPDVVAVLLHHTNLAWRLEGSSMLVVRTGQHSPHEVEAKLHFMDAVLDRIPDHVRSRLIGERPS